MIALASGRLNGLKLKSPLGVQTRPSGERLRQGIFNILRGLHLSSGPPVEGAVVADIFAGSGAWGLEAVSNGAAGVVFIENHPLALDALRANITTSAQALRRQGASFKCSIIDRDVVEGYGQLPPCRVIFADPPYDKGWFPRLLEFESDHGAVESGGLFIYEAQEKEEILTGEHDALLSRAGLTLKNEKKYGDSRVYFFVKQG